MRNTLATIGVTAAFLGLLSLLFLVGVTAIPADISVPPLSERVVP